MGKQQVATKALKKDTLGKGKSTSSASKVTKKKEVKKTPLKKAALDKLGKVSLLDKVKMAAKDEDDDEKAAMDLKKSLSPVQNSQIWNQHNKYLQQHPEEAAGMQHLSKKEKGVAAALWFYKKTKPKFMSLQLSMDAQDKVTLNDQWVSEKMCLDKFGSDEMQRHLNSGRLLWREDPWTKGVWQYKDQGDFSRQKIATRAKNLATGQEHEPEPEQEGWFEELFNQDLVYDLC